MADEAITDATGKTTGFLKKKVGFLEVWQWAAAAAGILVAYMAYRNYIANAGASTPTATVGNPISTSPITDLGATGTQNALAGQLADLQQVLASTPTAVTAPTNSGQTSSANNLAQFTSFSGSPAGLQLAQSNPNAYVNLEYQDVLGRAPDTSGGSFWAQNLGPKTTGSQLAQQNAAFISAAQQENPTV